jgi:hypothetical protein
MQGKNSRSIVKASTITQGALTVTLIFVYFLLFKGVANILNALLVPLTLYVFSRGRKMSEVLAVYSVLVLICALFLNLQIIFILFYCGIAYLLSFLSNKNYHTVVSLLILAFAVSLSFWVAIMLTDYIFLTHINAIMMKILKGNLFAYALMLFAEGSLVALSLFFLSKKINKMNLGLSK